MKDFIYLVYMCSAVAKRMEAPGVSTPYPLSLQNLKFA